MWRLEYFLCAVFILCSLITEANAENNYSPTSAIESYLTSIDYDHEVNTVDIFSNFIVKENDDLYTVDFMIDENGEVIVLSMDYEEEFYKVDSYSSINLKTYKLPLAQISDKSITTKRCS